MSVTAVPPFVSADWLAAATPPPVLVDLRWSLDGSLGRRDYLERHLPGAVYLDLDTVAAGPPTAAGGRHPLPDPAAFAASLGELGIGQDDPVVAYDQGPGVIAARLVWMLRAIGQPAAVLEGGLAGWSGPVEAGQVTRTPVVRAVCDWPADRLADADLTARVAARPDGVVLDARDAVRFSGEREPIDPRPGHIPGAVNLPVTDNLDAAGRLLVRAALSERYASTGALEADEVVAYCGSGVAACHGLLVLEELGVHGRLFPGSWSAWSADPGREAAIGTG
ncbi:MAG: sulfurtransferase [Intrasporangiaceae bacterium]|nr:sulfurtransferase [Intrasporangiaceae bacterium]